MSKNYEKFRRLLQEMFQLDQADLDFGIYRIMNQKRDEIVRFLSEDLLPQVKGALAEYAAGDNTELKAELAKVEQQVRDAGMNPDDSPKVQGLRAQLTQSFDLTAMENEVFSHLVNFFRRYYSEGDFISLRRYKEGVYAIPYEGEEVKLHWANYDQYYVKSSEYFRDYTFVLPSGKQVHFKLVEADTEKDNRKAQAGQERRFILAADAPVVEQNGELIIRFEYRPENGNPNQKDLNAQAITAVFAENLITRSWQELATPQPTPGNPTCTLLEKHLTEYTARNTFDYFIHKGLGKFLRRELDFFIKNEVIHLDDIDESSTPKVEQYLVKVRAIRRIANKIITFLAQLEDFQKKLWLKKKFVVETNYCITLDRVPEEFYPEIAANEAQREEWIRLFTIDKMNGGDGSTLTGLPKYTVPLTLDFLKAFSFLMIDTRHYGDDFTSRLVTLLGDLEDQCDGLLVHSDNFQALNLLDARYKGKVRCIYIDPPYNTDASPILYKNNYKSSTWTALMFDRLEMSIPFLVDKGVLVAAIDDEQQRELSYLLESIFQGNLLGTICVRANPSGRPTKTGYSVSHEYLFFAGKSSRSAIGRMPPTPQQLARFNQKDKDGIFEWRNLRREGSDSNRTDRPKLYYPIYIKGESIRVPAMTWNEMEELWIIDEEPLEGELVVYPDNEDGEQKRWRWEWGTVMTSVSELAVRKDRSGRDYIYYKRRPKEDGVVSVSSWFDAKYSATEHGSAVIKGLFDSSPFSYPKSIFAVIDAIYIAGGSDSTSIVMDYFAGSGTTAHAVLQLNRMDGGRRKYVLIETETYFDTVIKPRLQKVVFSPDWEDGKPESTTSGLSHCFKYIRLESYEDTLNNLIMGRSREQEASLFEKGSEQFREDYMLGYMLGIESRNNLLNIQAFEDPFNYQLNIATGTAGETKPTKVDLVETFNYLIGLTVHHIDHIQGFRIIEGTSPRGERVLVIWRNTNEKSNADLDAFFEKMEYNTRDQEYDIIYVNGDNNLENLRREDQTWKVRLIEEDFHRLMFDVDND